MRTRQERKLIASSTHMNANGIFAALGALTGAVIVAGVMAAALSGCAGNPVRFDETLTKYDTDGNVESVSETRVKSSQFATVGAKQDKAASAFHYEAGQSAQGDDFLLSLGSAAEGQQGDSLADIVKAVASIAGLFSSPPAAEEAEAAGPDYSVIAEMVARALAERRDQ
tara:strand:+ start:652 stop:1158 length:507 start_codon:yes stop_codon:yes gene_type:complete